MRPYQRNVPFNLRSGRILQRDENRKIKLVVTHTQKPFKCDTCRQKTHRGEPGVKEKTTGNVTLSQYCWPCGIAESNAK